MATSYYYIDSNTGAATGDNGRYASQQTGNVADLNGGSGAGAYASMNAMITAATDPVAGDIVCFSDNSAESMNATILFTGVTSSATGVTFISVSETNVDQYSAGASITSLNYRQIQMVGNCNFTGINFSCGSTWAVTNFAKINMTDCSMLMLDSGDDITSASSSQNGATMEMTNVNVTVQGITEHLLEHGCRWTMYGGSYIDGGTDPTDFVQSSTFGSNRGVEVTLMGTDCSAFTTAMIGTSFSTWSNNKFRFIMDGCKLKDNTVIFADTEFANNHQFLKATRCSDSAAAAEYQFFQRSTYGDVEDQDDTGIHRDESTDWPGGLKVSYKVTTSARCSRFQPLSFDLPSRYCELTNGASDVITIYFANIDANADLTDTNFWAVVSYPDSTNKQTFKLTSNQATDKWAAGTKHTDDSSSSTWKLNTSTDLTGYDEQRMDITTSTGADSAPIITIYCGEPSITFYVDTTIGLS